MFAFFDQTHRNAGHRRVTGTPASISDKEPPHTLAIEVEPLDSKISETMRMV
jgi:hypothetical protein